MNNKKVILVFPALPKYLPYVETYEEILCRNHIDYVILCWNRKGDSIKRKPNLFVFEERIDDCANYIKKILVNIRFCMFILSHLKKIKYSSIIMSTISLVLCIFPLLPQYYKKRFIFDIRDYTNVIGNKFVKMYFDEIVKLSKLTIISSNGFCVFLPSCANITVTHNIVQSIYEDNKSKHVSLSKPIKIGTVGLLRLEPNITLMNKFGNNDNYQIDFYGSSDATLHLETYAKTNNLKNVIFHGYYHKSEEPKILQEIDLLSLYLNNESNSKLLMTNRIYLGAIYRKPMIVNAKSYQGEIIEKFHLGVLVEDETIMTDSIEKYLEYFDNDVFVSGCEKFLKSVKKDMINYENKILDSI